MAGSGCRRRRIAGIDQSVEVNRPGFSSETMMDQNGFGLMNSHTNVYASTYRPRTQTQTMLCRQITLSITPVRWGWRFGDGATLTTDVPGYSQDRFNEETPTSHV